MHHFALRRLHAAIAGLRQRVLLVLLVIAAAGCGRAGGPVQDAYGACNAFGGAHRANDFSLSEAEPVHELTVVTFPGLTGGIMAPPLELSGTRMAFIARSATSATLAVVRRDSLLSRYDFPPDQHPMPALAADSAGVIYAITTRGTLHAIGGEGKLLWQRETFTDPPADDIVVPAAPLALGRGVVVGNSAGEMARYDEKGAPVWKIRRGGSPGRFFAADPALGIVVGLTGNSYETIDSVSVIDAATGTERWTAALPAGQLVYGPVIIGNLIVAGAAARDEQQLRAPYLIAFHGDGTAAWRHPLVLMPRGIAGDREGNIYVSCAGISAIAMGGAMVSIDQSGGQRWQVAFESGLPAPPLVSREWVYAITRNQGRTGLFTYGRDGTYGSFVSIHLQPDVLATLMLSSYGEPVMAGVNQPVLIRGN